jgi:hypothetical protein
MCALVRQNRQHFPKQKQQRRREWRRQAIRIILMGDKPLLRFYRFGKILRRCPDIDCEIAAAEDAQLAHDSDIILRVDEVAPIVQGFEVDGDRDLRRHLERISVVADFDDACVRQGGG